jgi:hypothetical protein
MQCWYGPRYKITHKEGDNQKQYYSYEIYIGYVLGSLVPTSQGEVGKVAIKLNLGLIK